MDIKFNVPNQSTVLVDLITSAVSYLVKFDHVAVSGVVVTDTAFLIRRAAVSQVTRSVVGRFEFSQVSRIDHRHDSHAEVDTKCVAVEEREETHRHQHVTTCWKACSYTTTVCQRRVF